VAAEVWLEISRGLAPFLGGEREFRGAGQGAGQVAQLTGKRPAAVQVAAHRGCGHWPPG
jgi:hypothetical protein